MSYLDLRTSSQLAEWRKQQMSSKIKELSTMSTSIIQNTRKIQFQAQALLQSLDCDADPRELKLRFLNGMREICEYIYVENEINLALQDFVNVSDSDPNLNELPEPDTTTVTAPAQPTTVNVNLLDMLSDPTPSTSMPIMSIQKPKLPKMSRQKQKSPKMSRQKPKVPKIKDEDQLIDFSSSSQSTDDISDTNEDLTAEENESTELPEQLIEIPAQLQSMHIQDTPNLPISLQLALPQGKTLEIDRIYDAYIVNAKELYIWVMTDNNDEMFYEFHSKLNDYYQGWKKCIPIEMLHNVTKCVAFVEETGSWARCYMVEPNCTETHAQVYLMDTGRSTLVPKHKIMPLQPDFYTLRELTHVCHLAGIKSVDRSPINLAGITNFIVQFMGSKCKVEVANKSSETISCYLRLEDNTTINHMLVECGLAEHVERQCTCNSIQEKQSETQSAPATEALALTNEVVAPDAPATPEDCQIQDTAGIRMNCSSPSYTNYEVDLSTNCSRWLLYGPKVPLPALPEPGARIAVRVTHVLNLNKVYVQILEPPPPPRQRTFGEILPPQTLDDLITAMNCRAIVPTYRRLEVRLKLESAPKPGDVVAAIYPLDRQYYRARVVLHNVHEQTIDVQFIDYGDEHSVLETEIFQLHPQFTHLPCQSILCTLSEVQVGNIRPENMCRMKNFLIAAAQDKELEARVISRSPRELQISLFYTDGKNLAEKMADTRIVGYQPHFANDGGDTALTADAGSTETW